MEYFNLDIKPIQVGGWRLVVLPAYRSRHFLAREGQWIQGSTMYVTCGANS